MRLRDFGETGEGGACKQETIMMPNDVEQELGGGGEGELMDFAPQLLVPQVAGSASR